MEFTALLFFFLFTAPVLQGRRGGKVKATSPAFAVFFLETQPKETGSCFTIALQ